jgi:uncharacterized protein YoxC
MIHLLMIFPVLALPLWFTDTVAVAQGLLSLAACVLLVLAIPAVIMARRAARAAADRVDALSRQLTGEVTPLLRDAATALTSLNEIMGAVRDDVHAVHETVVVTAGAVRETVESTHARLERLGLLVDVVQDELEDIVMGTIGAVQRARSGASAVGGGVRNILGRLLGRLATRSLRDGAREDVSRSPRPYRRTRV